MTDYTENTAREYAGGDRVYILDGKLNRVDGPAIETVEGHCEWWLNGKRMSEEEHARLTSPHGEIWPKFVKGADGNNKLVKGCIMTAAGHRRRDARNS